MPISCARVYDEKRLYQNSQASAEEKWKGRSLQPIGESETGTGRTIQRAVVLRLSAHDSPDL